MADLIIEEPPVVTSSIPDEIQQRYTNWKKNTKLLYDYLNTNTSKWPSLSCQFLPDLNTTDDTHRILLSSFTSRQLPQDESVYIGSISTMSNMRWSSLNNFDMTDMEFKMENSVKLCNKDIEEEVRITYPDGDCNRCRYMPQNPDLIATVSSNGSVYVFDRTKHGNKVSSGIKYEVQCKGQDVQDESLSLAWNWQDEGKLASCQSNGNVKVWDITKYNRTDPTITEPEHISFVDANGINDVSWMVNHRSILASCGESNIIGLIDLRLNSAATTCHRTTHMDGINAIEFNYYNDMILGSGDSEGNVKIWDLRDLKVPLREWSHQDAISALQWNPSLPSIIATSGQEQGLVKIWDSAIEPSENNHLLFVHGGHMLGVNDISWCLHDSWTMCSVSNDNSIHIWKPAKNLVDSKP